MSGVTHVSAVMKMDSQRARVTYNSKVDVEEKESEEAKPMLHCNPFKLSDRSSLDTRRYAVWTKQDWTLRGHNM
jgi:hypothetical protein